MVSEKGDNNMSAEEEIYGLEMAGEEDEEYLEQFAYVCIACGHETIHNPCHHCGTLNVCDDKIANKSLETDGQKDGHRSA